ncbi:hypothetical protein [Pseudomonas sp. FFUP_PS_473]|nr:hypothetical protein [Pseudomonas sp. FFUP_PS_473]
MFPKLKNFTKAFSAEFSKAAKAAPAMYFAPLTGAIKAVREQMQKSL